MIENEMIDETGSVYGIKEVKELHDDLLKCLSYDEWSSREYGTDAVDFDDTAYSLYKLGYRKIQDGDVVLSKDEYDDLKHRPSTREWVETCRGRIEQARKETAREIFDYIKRNSVIFAYYDENDCFDELDIWDFKRFIKDKYGVEVEE